MKIIVFGATGTLGRVIVEQALEDDHLVTAFTRSGRFEYSRHANLSIVQGDVYSPPSVANAIEGHEGVICALGAGRKGGVRAVGTNHILAGMKIHNVKRFICLSSLGVGDSAPSLNFFWKNIMFGLLLRPAFSDHIEQEKLIHSSDRDWTIVRPAAFTDGPKTGSYQHGFSSQEPQKLSLKVSRADVAEFMVSQLGHDQYMRQTPAVSY